jgi:hypothetical protein
MTKFGKSEKLNNPVWHSEWSSFGSFRTEQRKKENMKTLMLMSVRGMYWEGETPRSQPICWWPNLTFCKNRSVRFAKLEHPVFIVMRWSIFLNGGQLYIFHKLDRTYMLVRLCTCFSDNLVEFHSKNKDVLQTTKYELKLKIWSLHDESLVHMIKMDIWNAWFGVQSRKLWHFEDAPSYKTRGSSLKN